MPRSAKPRKKYRPKYTESQLRAPVTLRYTKDSEMWLQMIPHQHLEKMRTGEADEESLAAITFRVNWGYVMAGEIFDNAEVREQLERALDAVHSLVKRYDRIQRVGCTGEEFRQIGEALNLCDEMQKAATRREQLHCAEIVERVTRYKLEQGQ